MAAIDVHITDFGNNEIAERYDEEKKIRYINSRSLAASEQDITIDSAGRIFIEHALTTKRSIHLSAGKGIKIADGLSSSTGSIVLNSKKFLIVKGALSAHELLETHSVGMSRFYGEVLSEGDCSVTSEGHIELQGRVKVEGKPRISALNPADVKMSHPDNQLSKSLELKTAGGEVDLNFGSGARLSHISLAPSTVNIRCDGTSVF